MTPAVESLTSREALRQHFLAVASGFAGVVTSIGTHDVRLHTTADPEVVVVEFVYVAQTAQGPLRLPNVFVMRVRDGYIVQSRDYSMSPG